jgi:L-seryl-tRNA(Ser) seleniumtransferase
MVNLYEKLGVTQLINAWGNATIIGGSIMPLEVLEAMKSASDAYVDLDDLLKKAGQKIADMIGVESAFITSGGAAAVVISTAACIAGKDPAKIRCLPDTKGMRNEVIILRAHYCFYEQQIRQAGGKIVEIGQARSSFLWELEQAINDQTAAVFYFADSETTRGSLPLIDIIKIAHYKKVPVLVDAASELPPVSNLHRFTKMGVDLVGFSGGKDIRGPQNSGLIIGRKDLIEACALNSCPNNSIGRSMKVSKETIVGLVKALEIYLSQDFDAEMEKWSKQVDYWVESLSKLSCVSVKRGFPNISLYGMSPVCIPKAYIIWDEEERRLKKEQVIDILQKGNPGIAVNPWPKRGIALNPQMLRDGEEKIVARRLIEVFSEICGESSVSKVKY